MTDTCQVERLMRWLPHADLVQRTIEPTRINEILNHHRVRPDVADLKEGPIDVTTQLQSGTVFGLLGEHGVVMMYGYGAGIYECHTAILPEGRGEWGRRFALAVVRFMFVNTDCWEIITRIPQGHIGAKAIAEIVGFRHQFTTLPECLFRGYRVPAHIYSLTLPEWSSRKFEGIADIGNGFHEWLNSLVPSGVPHPHDPAHNLTVGICLLMLFGGQIKKAVTWYNRSALAARHEPIRLIKETPPTVRFDAGILSLIEGTLTFEPE